MLEERLTCQSGCRSGCWGCRGVHCRIRYCCQGQSLGSGLGASGDTDVERDRYVARVLDRALGDYAYIGRMPRMQVYLSDELYNIVKSQGLSPSGLLQDAVRAHCERREKIRLTQEWAQEIFAELGPPSAEEVEWAENKAREIIESLRAGAEAVAARQARHPED